MAVVVNVGFGFIALDAVLVRLSVTSLVTYHPSATSPGCVGLVSLPRLGRRFQAAGTTLLSSQASVPSWSDHGAPACADVGRVVRGRRDGWVEKRCELERIDEVESAGVLVSTWSSLALMTRVGSDACGVGDREYVCDIASATCGGWTC
jgi:hypothetical protein